MCFTVDRLEPFEKIKGMKIDFIPATTSSAVKTPQPPPRSGGREFYSTDQYLAAISLVCLGNKIVVGLVSI